eukprot:TRINITY_DN18788_c0_g1_i1.p1 TRINITY_DN18788_c0_g1~~TRINITY_DN18788_c0_g1_i1.p1  ORF type:complete len:827 (-),score=144.59 TRINITY_DN18788_c0_g1_i1:62-2542(-)
MLGPALNVTLSALGALSIGLGAVPWFDSGPVVLRDHAQWYSSDCTALLGPCLPMHPQSVPPLTGRDSIGEYRETSVAWSPADSSTSLMVTGVRTYESAQDVVVLTQHFPQGLHPENSHGDPTEVVSGFPTLATSHQDLGGIMYEGVQLQNTRTFKWPAGTPFGDIDPHVTFQKQDTNGGGMPLVLTTVDGSTLVASPLEDFFTSCQTASQQLKGVLSFGMQGTLGSAAPGHVHSTVLVGSGTGVRDGMLRWGDLLLKASGHKQRSMSWTKEGDIGLHSLSYYTDNGAYYYYQTANGTGACAPPNAPCSKTPDPSPKDGTGYQATVRLLSAYLTQSSIPVRAIQYDSWWYYKGNTTGILLWEPMPSTLGGSQLYGDPSTWLHANWSAVTHSRWFQADNMYLLGTAPGLPADWREWTWVTEHSTDVAVSTDVRFFRHIFSRAKRGLRMATYEQDFLAHQYESVPGLAETPGLAREWLAAMSAAAEAENVTIQYCMSLPRHILQSASFPSVTHARASHDYGQSRGDGTEQWSPIGLTSLLYWSVGLLPFKDDFWSTSVEPGNHWGSIEADPELQAVVSALIGGPVGPADAIGLVNRTRVMRTCRADGTLLKPAAPAMQLDSTFRAMLAGDERNPIGGVQSAWGTTIQMKGSTAFPGHLLLFANISAAGFVVSAKELEHIDGSNDSRYIAREFYTGELRVLDSQHSLQVAHSAIPAACANAGLDLEQYCIPFELWTAVRVPDTAGWVLMGEMDKYVAISPQRFESVSARSIELFGTPGEVVRVGLVDCRKEAVCQADIPASAFVRISCTIASSGRARLNCGLEAACTCAP